MSDDFQQTFALVLCQTAFHDCEDASRRKEYIVSFGIVQKPAWHMVIPFASATDKFRDDLEDSPTLILVWLHRHLRLFLDLYFDRYHQHFVVMPDSGMPSNVGHPQRFVGALLHNAFPAGDKPSPKAKLPPAFLDHPMKFPIDSCIREYQDWTTNCEDQSSKDEHFVWLSNEFTPFQTNPRTPYVPLDFTLGLPAVENWLKGPGKFPGSWTLPSTPGKPYNLTTNPLVPAQGMKGRKEERRSTVSLRTKNLR